MFSGASSFNQPLDAWDVSHATYMNYAFYETSLFNHPLNSWDVSSVVNMGYMFFCASSFNQPLNSWNVSSVTSMASTFEDASSFNQPLASWNVSSVTSMNQMFSGASSFDQSLDAWNISSVLNMGEMFKDVTLTTSNYDDMLVSWSLLLLQNDVPFHAGNSQFHAGTAETARQLIIDMFGWTITDGGQVPMAPSAPTLNKIEISSSGNVMLAWNPVEGATIFRIYRSPSPINDVSGLTAIITELTGTTYQDTIFTIGTYYYVVVASNAGGDSPISNCESVLTIKFITVVSPKAGSSWIPKQYYYIEWSSTSSISNVQIELYNNGELVMLIHSEIQNDGKNLWRIPSDLESSETYQIKIFDTSDPSVFGLSAEFEIINNEGSSIPGYSSLFFVSVLGGIATLVMLNRRKST
jgi:surface protein